MAQRRIRTEEVIPMGQHQLLNAHVDERVVDVPVRRAGRGGTHQDVDRLAVEEPLEIRLRYEIDGSEKNIAVTMRTPGRDVELAVGFLHGEGIVRRKEDVDAAWTGASCASGKRNVVTIGLAEGVEFDASRLDRSFYTTSSCGVCGKTSIAAIATNGAARLDPTRPAIACNVLHGLPGALRASQAVFEQTGGLHAAGLFDASGTMLSVREDVGRHNALDKLVGASFLAGELPLSESILLVSGRASFELVQKAVMAGIPIMAAVGAPSSLAVDLAASYGMTLAGFVRDGRFNLYAGVERVSAG